MNRAHMEFCTSEAWQEMLEELILPAALGRADLGPRVLEIGPGPGFTTEVLLRAAQHVTAVELDPDLAGRLIERVAGPDVEVLVGDARSIDLPDSSFSGAASFNMLHHVPTPEDQDSIFAELFRLVAPGGALLVTDGSDDDAVREFHKDDVYNPIDPRSLPTRLGAVGFAGAEVVTYDLGWICAAQRP